eukprot:Mrub_06588.p2 GENE.Mrub_06588~~Mrub_06588.p2  ORF type:complete len:116 (-),score=23.23 Mrub_06588:86-433(-)
MIDGVVNKFDEKEELTITCDGKLSASEIENIFRAKNVIYLLFEKADKGIKCGAKLTKEQVKKADQQLTEIEFKDFMKNASMQNLYFGYLFKANDKDNSGTLQLNEFIDFIKENMK